MTAVRKDHSIKNTREQYPVTFRMRLVELVEEIMYWDSKGWDSLTLKGMFSVLLYVQGSV